MKHGNITVNVMIDTSEFFRVNESSVEVYITGISHAFSRAVREYNMNVPDVWLNRVAWVVDEVGKRKDLILSKEHLILDCRMENIYVTRIALETMKRLNIPKDKFTILLSVTPKEELDGYQYKIDWLAEINWCYFHDRLMEENIDWESIELDDKPILSLSGRATVNRAIFTKQLLDFFGDRCRASFGVTTHYALTESKIMHLTDLMKPYPFPFSQHTDDKVLGPIHLQHNPPGHMLYKSLVSLVHETNDSQHDRILLTEKTFKAFAWHQLPIFVATPGHVRMVRELGFDLFDDIIDHSYDDCTNPNRHRVKVFLQITKLINMNPAVEDWQKLRKKLWSRIVANHELVIKLKENRIIEHWPHYG